MRTRKGCTLAWSPLTPSLGLGREQGTQCPPWSSWQETKIGAQMVPTGHVIRKAKLRDAARDQSMFLTAAKPSRKRLERACLSRSWLLAALETGPVRCSSWCCCLPLSAQHRMQHVARDEGTRWKATWILRGGPFSGRWLLTQRFKAGSALKSGSETCLCLCDCPTPAAQE